MGSAANIRAGLPRQASLGRGDHLDRLYAVGEPVLDNICRRADDLPWPASSPDNPRARIPEACRYIDFRIHPRRASSAHSRCAGIQECHRHSTASRHGRSRALLSSRLLLVCMLWCGRFIEDLGSIRLADRFVGMAGCRRFRPKRPSHRRLYRQPCPFVAIGAI